MSPRRQALIACFEAAQPRWLSLDIFDTLLWRPMERPVDVFPHVHRRLVEAGHWLGIGADEYARARIAAEAAARRRHPSTEIRIDEVCAELSAMLGGQADPAALADAELAAERACLRLDADIGALVLHASKRGVRYVLVSDMYLRSAHLLDLIGAVAKRAGLALPQPEHVFVSGERRTGKGSGMFDLVLDTLGCAPAQVLHVGDNPAADVEAPAKRGIRVFHYRRESRYARRVFELERRLPHAGGDAHDFGLDAMRAKAVLASQGEADAPADAFQYGALIMGPLLASFAEWVAVDCHARRQRRVYCLMREGHLLAPLVDQAAHALGIELEVRTLEASRYAWRGATFRRATAAALRGYFNKRYGLSLAMAAGDLGVDLQELSKASGLSDGHALDPAAVQRVIDALVGTPALRSQIVAAAGEKRRRLLRYFAECGVLDEERLALVDLGWAGSQQRYLAQLLADAPQPREIRGLYFATHAGLLELDLARCTAASFLIHLGVPEYAYRPLGRTPEIIENACVSPAGSFQGIDAEGRAQYFAPVLPAGQLAQIGELQRGVERFAELWRDGAAERRQRMSHADWERHLARLRAVLVRSLEQPLAEEAVLLKDWQHEANDGSAMAEPIVGTESVRARARRMNYRRILEMSPLECYWPQGLARLLGKRPGTPWQRWLESRADG